MDTSKDGGSGVGSSTWRLVSPIRMAWLFVTIATPLPAFQTADAQRGSEFFKQQMCMNCHSVHGEGGSTAPDLGHRLDRNYTPAGIASRMWNHAPTLWEAMKRQSIP